MIIYLIFWDYPTKMEYIMDYKIISKVISKGELGRKKFIKEEFVLQKEPQKHLNLIHGVIVDKNNIKVKDCAILLQCKIKSQQEYEDLSLTYTNEDGVFGFQVEIDNNKDYKILVFAPNQINLKGWLDG